MSEDKLPHPGRLTGRVRNLPERRRREACRDQPFLPATDSANDAAESCHGRKSTGLSTGRFSNSECAAVLSRLGVAEVFLCKLRTILLHTSKYYR